MSVSIRPALGLGAQRADSAWWHINSSIVSCSASYANRKPDQREHPLIRCSPHKRHADGVLWNFIDLCFSDRTDTGSRFWWSTWSSTPQISEHRFLISVNQNFYTTNIWTNEADLIRRMFRNVILIIKKQESSSETLLAPWAVGFWKDRSRTRGPSGPFRSEPDVEIKDRTELWAGACVNIH